MLRPHRRKFIARRSEARRSCVKIREMGYVWFVKWVMYAYSLILVFCLQCIGMSSRYVVRYLFHGSLNNGKQSRTYNYNGWAKTIHYNIVFLFFLVSVYPYLRLPQKRTFIFKYHFSRTNERGHLLTSKIESLRRYQNPQQYICCKNLQILLKRFVLVSSHVSSSRTF